MEQRMDTRIRENVVINKTHKTSPSCTTHQSIKSINSYSRAVVFVLHSISTRLDSAAVALVTLLAHHNGEYVRSMYPADSLLPTVIVLCSSRSGALSHISQYSSHESLPEFIISEDTKRNETKRISPGKINQGPDCNLWTDRQPRFCHAILALETRKPECRSYPTG